MIKVGKIYTSKSGERFLILAKKNRPSSNGFDWIGENTRTGLVTYFNHLGKHVLSEDWELKTDPYKWLPMYCNTPKGDAFVPKEDIQELSKLTGLLRIENDDPNTIKYFTNRDFVATYA